MIRTKMAVLLFCTASLASAQQPADSPVFHVGDRIAGRVVTFHGTMQNEMDGPVAKFGGTELVELVKGAPYSGDLIIETVQTLADGNHITNKSVSKVYRDSRGRTRRELGLEAQVPYVMKIQGQSTVTNHIQVTISDPAAGVSYALDPQSRTARKVALPAMHVETSDQGESYTINAGKQPVVMARRMSTDAKTESLGTRTIEGVEAEGKRTTVTIPAGKFGNELPIVITTETWFSPTLHRIVLSRRHDPRIGDTTLKLTNIDQTEPMPSLFQVPSDYTVTDATPGEEREIMIIR